CAAFAPDGRCLISGSGGELVEDDVADGEDCSIRIWDTVNGQALRCLRGHSSLVTCVACSPARPQLASASRNGSLCLWDLEAFKLVRYFQRRQPTIFSACFSRDGTRLLAGGAENVLGLWNVDNGR